MAINDKIIMPIFNAMVIYKPKLAMLLPQDEEDDDFDVRQLADEIIKGFPWPIGIELRRLFASGMDKPDRGRLDQFIRTLERIMQFTSFVMLSQLLEESINKKCELPNDLLSQFTKRFSVLSMGTYAWLIRSIGSIFIKNQIEPFMSEMTSVFTNDFYQKLEFWVPERNDIGHYQINLPEEEIEKRCFEYQDRLTKTLVDLAFFIKYPLVTITEINVLKNKRKLALYNHKIKILNHTSSDFHGKEMSYDKYSDNHSVLLLKNFKNAPDTYLNLSPLIIDTHTEVLNSREQIKTLKKDIFLYTKWQNDRLHYIGTMVTDKCDLRLLSSYDQLVEEFKEYLTVFAEIKV